MPRHHTMPLPPPRTPPLPSCAFWVDAGNTTMCDIAWRWAHVGWRWTRTWCGATGCRATGGNVGCWLQRFATFNARALWFPTFGAGAGSCALRAARTRLRQRLHFRCVLRSVLAVFLSFCSAVSACDAFLHSGAAAYIRDAIPCHHLFIRGCGSATRHMRTLCLDTSFVCFGGLPSGLSSATTVYLRW
jgi:hypothetical protein